MTVQAAARTHRHFLRSEEMATTVAEQRDAFRIAKAASPTESTPHTPPRKPARCFEGLTVCVTGLSKEERAYVQLHTELLSETGCGGQQGGIYSSSLHSGCTHLLAVTVRGRKYEVARRNAIKWGLALVPLRWFLACIERQERLNERSYLISASAHTNSALSGSRTLHRDYGKADGTMLRGGSRGKQGTPGKGTQARLATIEQLHERAQRLSLRLVDEERRRKAAEAHLAALAAKPAALGDITNRIASKPGKAETVGKMGESPSAAAAEMKSDQEELYSPTRGDGTNVHAQLNTMQARVVQLESQLCVERRAHQSQVRALEHTVAEWQDRARAHEHKTQLCQGQLERTKVDATRAKTELATVQTRLAQMAFEASELRKAKTPAKTPPPVSVMPHAHQPPKEPMMSTAGMSIDTPLPLSSNPREGTPRTGGSELLLTGHAQHLAVGERSWSPRPAALCARFTPASSLCLSESISESEASGPTCSTPIEAHLPASWSESQELTCATRASAEASERGDASPEENDGVRSGDAPSSVVEGGSASVEKVEDPLAGMVAYLDPEMGEDARRDVRRVLSRCGGLEGDTCHLGGPVTHAVCEPRSGQAKGYLALGVSVVSSEWMRGMDAVHAGAEGPPMRTLQMSMDIARGLFRGLSDVPQAVRSGLDTSENRSSLMSRAKVAVREHRGKGGNQGWLKGRPPQALLEGISWRVVDSLDHARMMTVEDASSPLGSTTPVIDHARTPQPHLTTNWEEVVYRLPFISILYPIDRFQECGFWCETYYCGAQGLTRRQLLEKIQGFYTEELTEEQWRLCIYTDSKHADKLRAALSLGDNMHRGEFLGALRNLECLRKVCGHVYEVVLNA
ncbi:hypothetical protein CYMTET_15672 [Cymbomonas tetramitiformis]|uniref:BRCT domain-containing protein n=1 Tax=Cymbomonas tetramitiformis TaxID=36881 RepID=A0AAE0L8X5_9CHLO|nr:hypothetical protein CYMTET_15672 [Cymbomonas tetramitiformis]